MTDITWGREIAVEGKRPAPAWIGDDIRVRWYGAAMRNDSWWENMVPSGSRFGDLVSGDDIEHIRLPADHFAYSVFDYNDAHPDEEPFVPWAGGDAAPADWDGGNASILLSDGRVKGSYGYETNKHGVARGWTRRPADVSPSRHRIIGYRRKRSPDTAGDAVPIAHTEDFLTQLRRVNGERYKAWTGDGVEDPLYLSNEFGGEAGEVQNVVKKLVREQRGWRGSRTTVEHLAEEIADGIICLDNLARGYGIDLAEAVAAKFNKTSDANGFPHKLDVIRPETLAERFTRATGHEVTPAVEAALAYWEGGE